jgi:hypothetical protein
MNLSLKSNTSALRFASVSALTDHYGGLLDDLAVYSRVLTASEILLHYDSGRQ